MKLKLELPKADPRLRVKLSEYVGVRKLQVGRLALKDPLRLSQFRQERYGYRPSSDWLNQVYLEVLNEQELRR